MFDTDKDTRPDPGETDTNLPPTDPETGEATEATATPPEGDQPAESQPNPPETVEDDDVDAIELREAQAAVEAEKADGEGDSGDEPGTDAAAAEADKGQQDQKATGKEGEGGDKPTEQHPTEAESPMIPKARFDEVLQQQQELARQNAYLQGQLEASKVTRQGPGDGEASHEGDQPPATQPDPAEQIQTIRTQINGLAEKFDNGEISAAEWKAQEADLQDRMAEIREAQLLAKVKPEKQPTEQLPSLADQHFVQTRTEELNREHPFVDLVSDDDFGFIRDRALHNLGESWQAMPAGPAKDMALREKVAELSDEYGPKLTGMTLDQARAKAAGTQPAGQAAEKPASASAQDRKTKLDMAGSMPPDVSQMTGSPGQEVPSNAQLETMSDEDIVNNLPASTRQKMMETGRI